jgi:hypothetical protein
MNQGRVRMIILSLWLGCMLASLFAAILAPATVGRDGSIGYEQISPMLTRILALFVAPLSCLVGFWFPTSDRQQAKTRVLSAERARVALLLTGVYLVVVVSLLLWPLYFVDYQKAAVGLNLEKSLSLTGRLGDALQIATLLSPLPLAPIHYLTSSSQ